MVFFRYFLLLCVWVRQWVLWQRGLWMAIGAMLLIVPACGRAPDAARNTKKVMKVILCFGNSITAAYGVDPALGWPALLQQRLEAGEFPWQVINAGISGETSAQGDERIDRVLDYPLDILVLELGINDALLGRPPEEIYRHLHSIISKVKTRHPEAGVLILGADLSPGLSALFSALAEETGSALLPDCLEGVLGNRRLLLPDGLHPNADGHARIAARVWSRLQPLIR